MLCALALSGGSGSGEGRVRGSGKEDSEYHGCLGQAVSLASVFSSEGGVRSASRLQYSTRARLPTTAASSPPEPSTSWIGFLPGELGRYMVNLVDTW